MTDYQPINCEWHDELEAAATRRLPVTLHWRGEQGEARRATGIVRDIDVSQGEEFVLFEVAGERLRIRLDRLDWRSFPLR